MRATDKAASSTPEQGVIIFVKPSPNWKASTVACLDKPIRSENGAMMGIVSAAFAVAEGMDKNIEAIADELDREMDEPAKAAKELTNDK